MNLLYPEFIFFPFSIRFYNLQNQLSENMIAVIGYPIPQSLTQSGNNLIPDIHMILIIISHNSQ